MTAQIVDREVTFEVEDDAEAARIHAYLTAAGYSPKRLRTDRNMEAVRLQMEAAVERFRLGSAEAVALQQLLAGADTADELAARLEISVTAARGRIRRLCRLMGAVDVRGLITVAKGALA